jgi:hypothetical protein
MAGLVVEKSVFASKSVWGGIIAAAPAIDTLLVMFGVIPAPLISEAAAAVTTLFGALFGIYGRVKATTKIK